jgi:hypothetical protein
VQRSRILHIHAALGQDKQSWDKGGGEIRRYEEQHPFIRYRVLAKFAIRPRGHWMYQLHKRFDIHYNARAEGHGTSHSQELEYALLVSVQAKRVADLYDRIVRRYRGQLEVLTPVLEIPIRIGADDDRKPRHSRVGGSKPVSSF